MRDWGKTGALWVAITVMLTTTCTLVTGAGAASNKLLFSAQFGWEVNMTKVLEGASQGERNLCTGASKDICQPGGEIGERAGGFKFANDVAVNATTGEVYVADNDHNRVQVFDASGQFLRMFGWNVNKTKVNEGAPQAERNICTEAVSGECESGVGGGLAGQMFFPQSIGIEQNTGDVFVQTEDARVDKYTAAGEFIWAIGQKVNATNGGNICTAASGNVCQQGTRSPVGSTTPGVFDESQGASILAVGGPDDLLYFGDQGRVQRFESTTGAAAPEISLHSLSPTGFVQAISVENSGNLDLVYNTDNATIRQYNNAGVEQASFKTPHSINGIALDGLGRIAVTETGVPHGTLYGPAGEELGVFAPPGGISSSEGLAFDGNGEHLYVADIGTQDIEIYGLALVAKVATGPAKCLQGPDSGTLATFGCELTGEVNPENVSGTGAWFQYGSSTALGLNTPKQPITTGSSFVPLTATVSELRPNETYYYRVAAEDQNTGGEPVTGQTLQVRTGVVPPRVTCGEPEAFDVTRSSVVLSCDVNPENTSTVYRFQYGACPELETKVTREIKLANEEEGECPGELETPSSESAVYAELGVVRTATGLQPSKNYHFRLVAANDHSEEALGEEGTFVTPAAPNQSASTGVPVGVGTTSATLTGIVNPDGAEATYTFQAGIYKGDETVFGSVGSGSTGPATGPEAESFTLTGLQPGVTYAYRLLISSAYGTAVGGAVGFTTTGLSDVVTEPPVVNMLAVPKIKFPKQAKSLTKAQQLAKALKSCRATKSKRKRARVTCETRARKTYGHASRTQKKKA